MTVRLKTIITGLLVVSSLDLIQGVHDSISVHLNCTKLICKEVIHKTCVRLKFIDLRVIYVLLPFECDQYNEYCSKGAQAIFLPLKHCLRNETGAKVDHIRSKRHAGDKYIQKLKELQSLRQGEYALDEDVTTIPRKNDQKIPLRTTDENTDLYDETTDEFTETYPNTGETYPNTGRTYSNTGRTYPNTGRTYPNTGKSTKKTTKTTKTTKKVPTKKTKSTKTSKRTTTTTTESWDPQIPENTGPEAEPDDQYPSKYSWIPISQLDSSTLPRFCPVIGRTVNRKLYGIRAYYAGQLLPGFTDGIKNKSYKTYLGVVTWYNKVDNAIKEFEVFCGKDFHWEEAEGGNVPANAIQVGVTMKNETLYLGRNKLWLNNREDIKVGRIHPAFEGLLTEFYYQEKIMPKYEVLCEGPGIDSPLDFTLSNSPPINSDNKVAYQWIPTTIEKVNAFKRVCAPLGFLNSGGGKNLYGIRAINGDHMQPGHLNMEDKVAEIVTSAGSKTVDRFELFCPIKGSFHWRKYGSKFPKKIIEVGWSTLGESIYFYRVNTEQGVEIGNIKSNLKRELSGSDKKEAKKYQPTSIHSTKHIELLCAGSDISYSDKFKGDNGLLLKNINIDPGALDVDGGNVTLHDEAEIAADSETTIMKNNQYSTNPVSWPSHSFNRFHYPPYLIYNTQPPLPIMDAENSEETTEYTRSLEEAESARRQLF